MIKTYKIKLKTCLFDNMKNIQPYNVTQEWSGDLGNQICVYSLRRTTNA
jgi:hypothetical protein